MDKIKKKEAAGYGTIVASGTAASVAAGLGSQLLNDQVFDMIVRFGLPLVLLAVVTKYSWALIAKKDDEIKRLNEARVRESHKHAERLYKVTAASQQMVDQTNATLDAIARSKKP